MSNLRLPQGSGAGGDAGGHNELEEVPNIVSQEQFGNPNYFLLS